MEIVRLVEEKVLSVAAKLIAVLEGQVSYQDFEMILKEELDGLGCEVLKVVLEELDREIKADKARGRKKKTIAKLVYIHEGVVGEKRKALINKRHFTTVNVKPVDFWYEIAEYIERHYDIDSIEQIFLSADGANWIKVGLDYIYDATFILDKFHLNKSIKAATAHAKTLKKHVYRGIYNLNQDKVLSNLREAHQQAEGEARQKRIIDTYSYIRNNWDGIVAQVKHPEVGCSAEGHVSHVLSARMSSRPMTWSSAGAEGMTQSRAVKANGESVKEHYLAGQEEAPVIVELKQAVKKELKSLRNKKSIGKEDTGNIPLLNGPDNLTRKALRGLSNCLAV